MADEESPVGHPTPTPSEERYYVKIIHISAMDSPNVRLALAQQKLGEKVTNEMVVDGVLSAEEYFIRRHTWDEVRQCIGIDGQFWEGAEVLLYPPLWLDRAERLWLYLRGKPRIARGMGVDPGEGAANTAISIVDEYGLIECKTERTPNTTRVVDMILETMMQYDISAERVLLDRGGGGLEHADRLRANGINVRTVGFNDKASIPLQRHKIQHAQKVETREKRSSYFNKRAEMYGEVRVLLDPGNSNRLDSAWDELATEKSRDVVQIRGFAISPEYHRLRQSMAVIPLKFELEQMKLPPKYKRNSNSKEVCLTDMIGFSPDELDSLVLAVHAMQTVQHQRTTAGAV